MVMIELIRKFWNYLKPHVVPILMFICIVLLCVYGRFLLKKEREDFVDKLKTYETLRDEESKKIVSVIEEERLFHQENIKRYQETMDMIQKKYIEDVKGLDDAKTIQVKKIVDKFNEDSTAAAKQISQLTGLKLVLQEEQK